MVNPFDKRNLSIFTEKGYGKKVPISEFPVQGRVGRGIIVYKPTTASGKIVTALVVEDSENILLIGKTNSICVSSLDVPVLSRTSMGNKIFENEIESVIKI
jgi:DNA gyrase subunit A